MYPNHDTNSLMTIPNHRVTAIDPNLNTIAACSLTYASWYNSVIVWHLLKNPKRLSPYKKMQKNAAKETDAVNLPFLEELLSSEIDAIRKCLKIDTNNP